MSAGGPISPAVLAAKRAVADAWRELTAASGELAALAVGDGQAHQLERAEGRLREAALKYAAAVDAAHDAAADRLHRSVGARNPYHSDAPGRGRRRK